MTEDEAKAKWCPFARPAASHPDDCGEVRGNRIMSGSPDLGALCVGSACMAWRRQTVMIDRATGEPAIVGVTAIGQLEPRWSAHGYCGLAGSAQ